MRRYAEKTKVPVDQTRREIEALIVRYGADKFGSVTGRDGAQVMFEMSGKEKGSGRLIRFSMTLIVGDDTRTKAEHRQRWRALLLCIKAKLESVAAGIESFDEAFMPHVVMPDGKTFAEHAKPFIEQAYLEAKMPPRLALTDGRN